MRKEKRPKIKKEENSFEDYFVKAAVPSIPPSPTQNEHANFFFSSAAPNNKHSESKQQSLNDATFIIKQEEANNSTFVEDPRVKDLLANLFKEARLLEEVNWETGNSSSQNSPNSSEFSTLQTEEMEMGEKIVQLIPKKETKNFSVAPREIFGIQNNNKSSILLKKEEKESAKKKGGKKSAIKKKTKKEIKIELAKAVESLKKQNFELEKEKLCVLSVNRALKQQYQALWSVIESNEKLREAAYKNHVLLEKRVLCK